MQRRIFSFVFLILSLGSTQGSSDNVYKLNDPSFPEMWWAWTLSPSGAGTLESPIGMSLDRAWTLHLGDAQTSTAILDCGIIWDHPDLAEQIQLNQGELPFPQEHNTYDANADGRFTPSDYADDTRVGDRNGNGILDGQDLILAFSNGVDSDGNGFVDDIAGWDFFENDNDPSDRTLYGHGTMQAEGAVAAINNRVGGAGACPKCTFLPIRIGDTFLGDGLNTAAGIRYAILRSATLAQLAHASFSIPKELISAFQLAREKGLIIVGASGDENSFHRNMPTYLDPVLYVNAVRYDGRSPQTSKKFTVFNNCGNYGLRVDISASGYNCSSEAVSHTAGVLALGASFAKSIGLKLSSQQLLSLLKETAHQIPDLKNSPGSAGRVNAFEFLKLIQASDRTDSGIATQATVEILTPAWFDLAHQGPLDVRFSLSSSSRLTPVQIELATEEDGRILHTTKKDFQSGVHTITIPIPKTKVASVKDRENQALTVFIRTADQKIPARRTIYVIDDPDLHPNFPKPLTGSAEGGALFADLNHDGRDELIAADASGAIHAFTSTGQELSGFPFQAGSKISFAAQLALTNEEYCADIVALSTTLDLFVVDCKGKLRKNFPRNFYSTDYLNSSAKERLRPNAVAAPVLADMDGDGFDDIVFGTLDGRMIALNLQGKMLRGYPVTLTVNSLRAAIASSPTVTDLNKDGIPDLIFGSEHKGENRGSIFAIDGRGTNARTLMLPGFPAQIPLLNDEIIPIIGSGVVAPPVVGDLLGDGQTHILAQGFTGKPVILRSDGTKALTLTNTPSKTSGNNIYCGKNPYAWGLGQPVAFKWGSHEQTFAVLFGTTSEFFAGFLNTARPTTTHGCVALWDLKKNAISYVYDLPDLPILNSAAIADIAEDDEPEILTASGGYFLHAFNRKGEVQGFPKFLGGWSIATPSLGDFDGDGFADVAISTREGFVFVWKTSKSLNTKWSTYKGGSKRHGVVK